MTSNQDLSGGGEHHGPRFKKYLLTGLLTAIPLWITWLLFRFVLRIVADSARPLIKGISAAVKPFSQTTANILMNSWLQTILAILLVLVILYLLGWLATKFIGRRLIAAFDQLMEKIPMVKTVYGGVRNLIKSFQKKPSSIQRVVLIDFPSPEMKTIGLVTRIIIDQDTGRELAAVYVPTTPNPTSGYLEIVPIEKVTSTNWTVDEAVAFVVSGGAVAPDRMNYEKSSTHSSKADGDKRETADSGDKQADLK